MACGSPWKGSRKCFHDNGSHGDSVRGMEHLNGGGRVVVGWTGL